jgi:hypothetical protein
LLTWFEVDADIVGGEHSQGINPLLCILQFLNEFIANEEGTKMGKFIKMKLINRNCVTSSFSQIFGSAL